MTAADASLLAAGLIESAVRDALSNKSYAQAARDWIDGAPALFSFDHCCTALSVNPVPFHAAIGRILRDPGSKTAASFRNGSVLQIGASRNTACESEQ
ncbi:MAG: hypothetical protein O2968_20765 [Acidobacteria bacterium]|nr:hypothetical protein [Acidobacteriota bacterium]